MKRNKLLTFRFIIFHEKIPAQNQKPHGLTVNMKMLRRLFFAIENRANVRTLFNERKRLIPCSCEYTENHSFHLFGAFFRSHAHNHTSTAFSTDCILHFQCQSVNPLVGYETIKTPIVSIVSRIILLLFCIGLLQFNSK